MAKPKFFVDSVGRASSKRVAPKIDKTPPARSFVPLSYMDDIELSCLGGLGYTMVMDIESYPNYFLIGFRCEENNKYVEFENSPVAQVNTDKLEWILANFRLITFNGWAYDIPMALLSLRGYNAEMLKYYSNQLTRKKADGSPDRVNWKEEFGVRVPQFLDHIDLIEVCPLKGSLKKYAARLHAHRLQELPFDHLKPVTEEQAAHIKNYCLGSDIPATSLILGELRDQIKLRYDLTQKYSVDVRSRSDAQIAEAVIRAEVKRKTGRDVKRAQPAAGTKFRYQAPAYIKFNSVGMQRLFDKIKQIEFEITEDGKLSNPEELQEMEFTIGKTTYKFGKGGLHSKEKCQAYKAEDGYLIIDSDVESYYPRLILNSGLYPEAIGPVFLEIFKEIVDRRLMAKKNAAEVEAELKKLGDKLGCKFKDLSLVFEASQSEADGLKITINGTFGKLGSRWSIMFAPNLLIQVTLGGQLSLAMLVERFESAGIEVISANTDGIVVYCHESKYETLKAIRDQWCLECTFKMEETRYKALYSRDVNNYFAVKMDGKVKLKGAYSNPWNDKKTAIFRFHKNPMSTICIEAAEQLITVGKPIEETIRQCKDISKFVCVRDVKGGAHRQGQFLGKLVRWVYAEGYSGELNYIESGNKVPDTEGAFPLMDLPDQFPDYIDYERYIEKAQSILLDVGFYKRTEKASLF